MVHKTLTIKNLLPGMAIACACFDADVIEIDPSTSPAGLTASGVFLVINRPPHQTGESYYEMLI